MSVPATALTLVRPWDRSRTAGANAVLETRDVAFSVITTADVDGIHFTADYDASLGRVFATKVSETLFQG